MKLFSLESKNFRGLKNQKITFDVTNDSKNISVLTGGMGQGKTTIQSAIIWALYGTILNDTKNLIPNSKNFIKIDINDKIETSVELVIQSKTATYTIIRTQTFEKKIQTQTENDLKDFDRNKHSPMITNDLLVYTTTKEHGPRKETDPHAIIQNRILTKSIYQFFLFDGEEIFQLFKPGKGSNVQNTVRRVSKIHLIDTCIKRLSDTIDEESERNDKQNPKLKKITDRIKEIKATLGSEDDPAPGTLYEEKTKLKLREGFLHDDLLRTQEQLEKYPAEDMKTAITNRVKYDKEIKDYDDKIKKIIEEMQQQIKNSSVPSLVSNNLTSLQNQIKKYKEMGKLPADFNPKELESLIAEKKCICGRDFSLHGDEHKKIQTLIDNAPDGSIGDFLVDCTRALDKQEVTTESSLKQWDTYAHQIFEIKEEQKKLNAKIKDINIMLDGEGESEFKMLNAKYTELANELKSGKINTEKIILDNKIKEHVEELAQIRREKSRKFPETDSETKKLIEDMEAGVTTLKQISRNLMEEVVADLMKETNTNFQELQMEKNKYENVKLNKEFEFTVTETNTGMPYTPGYKGGPSEGETQMLAYAFAISLIKVTGFDFPLVVDTPLGRISGDPRKLWAKRLISYMKDTQLIIFPTDTEYQDVADILAPNVSTLRKVTFNKDQKEIEITE